MSKKKSLRGAINQMCKSCIHDPESPGTWRQQVEDCTSDGENGTILCPLYDLRPMPTVTRDLASQVENSPELA